MILRRGTITAQDRSWRGLASPTVLPTAGRRLNSSAQVGVVEGHVIRSPRCENTREVPRCMPGRHHKQCRGDDMFEIRTIVKSGVRRSPATYGILRQPRIFIFTDTRCRSTVCHTRVKLRLHIENNRYRLTGAVRFFPTRWWNYLRGSTLPASAQPHSNIFALIEAQFLTRHARLNRQGLASRLRRNFNLSYHQELANDCSS